MLLKVLDFLKSFLKVGSVGDLLRMDVKEIVQGLQAYVNARVSEGKAVKTIRFEMYLARSFFSFYEIEINPKKIRIPRKAGKIRIDRILWIVFYRLNELKRYLENYPHQRGYIFCSKNNPEKRIPKNRFYENYRELLRRLGLDAKTLDGSAGSPKH
ncbi:MAG: hypothetical protein NZ929_04975 [Aigarchaeota archaeon]|nr:hypothetical protein [Aigarchaeota archaeon]MDW7987014.1 hypothetical protein [Nitrososphaerota archaeon]